MSFTTHSCHNGNSIVNPKIAKVAISGNDPRDQFLYDVAMSTTTLPWMNLATWRRKKGFTQEQLGNILGVGKSAISRWESGSRQMNLEDIQRVAEIFGIEPMALFLSPDDFDKAKSINDFAKLIDQIGLDRANAILTAMKPPENKLP